MQILVIRNGRRQVDVVAEQHKNVITTRNMPPHFLVLRLIIGGVAASFVDVSVLTVVVQQQVSLEYSAFADKPARRFFKETIQMRLDMCSFSAVLIAGVSY